jgi:hypothetical protein
MSNLLEDKRNQYREYIDNHVSNVWNAWSNYKNLFICTVIAKDYEYNKLKINLLKHDESKYSEEEFEFYRKNFFPVSNTEKENNKENFEMAIEHHYKCNPHHWNYWVDDNGVAKEMEDIYIIEMICDWIAMGTQFGNTASEYYMKNRDKINLHPATKEKVEYILSQMN